MRTGEVRTAWGDFGSCPQILSRGRVKSHPSVFVWSTLPPELTEDAVSDAKVGRVEASCVGASNVVVVSG